MLSKRCNTKSRTLFLIKKEKEKLSISRLKCEAGKRKQTKQPSGNRNRKQTGKFRKMYLAFAF